MRPKSLKKRFFSVGVFGQCDQIRPKFATLVAKLIVFGYFCWVHLIFGFILNLLRQKTMLLGKSSFLQMAKSGKSKMVIRSHCFWPKLLGSSFRVSSVYEQVSVCVCESE